METKVGYHTEEQCKTKMFALFNEIKDLKEIMGSTDSLYLIKYHVDSLYQLATELRQEYK